MTEPTFQLPTAEEVLAGQTQAGVPRPGFLDREQNEDGTVMRVGSRPVPLCSPDLNTPALARWAAFKALLRLVFGGKVDR